MPIQNAGTGNDVRGRAAAILSGHKLRMLEAADISVVDKQRLEALEEIARRAEVFVHRWSSGRTKQIYTREEEQKYKKQCVAWERELLAAVNELEAMEGAT